ncbi:MAG: DUF2291 domain-containing protein [Bacteroidales bacterium]|nr:DUF2291 domain-containing protein [Bacteroidales bacterium]
MNKILKYILIAVAVLLLIYLSLDIENLQEYNSRASSVAFNASDFASDFWENSLPQAINEAPDITELYRILEDNPEEVFTRFGHKLGISSTGYFFMKGVGRVESIEEEFIVVTVDENITLQLATEYIFGNAVRDGSGKVNINDFVNMTDFNNTSVEINKLIKEKVIPRLLNIAEPGKTIEFAGAAEIKENQINMGSLRIIPVKVNLMNGSFK